MRLGNSDSDGDPNIPPPASAASARLAASTAIAAAALDNGPSNCATATRTLRTGSLLNATRGGRKWVTNVPWFRTTRGGKEALPLPLLVTVEVIVVVMSVRMRGRGWERET